VAWLTGSQKKKARGEMLALIDSGEAALVVGTHAVIQEQVQFARQPGAGHHRRAAPFWCGAAAGRCAQDGA
jgi:hypothetical protein